MGAGCSSPLKKFGGGKRKGSKSSRKESSLIGDGEPATHNQDHHHHRHHTTTSSATDHHQNSQLGKSNKQKLNLENEITVQSEVNDDHPSTASYYTDGDHTEETRPIDPATLGSVATDDQQAAAGDSLHPGKAGSQNEGSTSSATGAEPTATSKFMGLNHDRHLLASPALSPAPSTCYSPSSQSMGSQPPGSLAQAKQKIFTIKGNHKHVVAVYPDKGQLLVWNIYEEKAVKTISNLDQPKDVRMVDQRRAVVLCNRELRVYDIESGEMLTKLKGVMNQRMPYYEVFDERYVITLARNRMYVNMLNLNTGELETTFKVGEDRFLNSLLLSANGGICVCGDETQKPFPLLVWNLNERRLMYDLRLDRHEFIMRLSAISDDGQYVVSVCKQLGDKDAPSHGSSSSSSTDPAKSSPNFIVIYDLSSGTLFKKWKPGLDTCGVAISITPGKSGKIITTLVDNNILVWEIATNSKRHTLVGHTAPIDVIKVQNNRLFSMDSTGRDQSLRVWDIEEGSCLAVFSPDAPVNCCQISIQGDALVCGFASETRLRTLVICKNEKANDVATDSIKA